MTENPTTCPECAGPHLRDLVFQHTAECGLYRAETATTAADHQRGYGRRPATATEVTLIEALGYPAPDEGEQHGIAFEHAGVHARTVMVLDAAGEYWPTEEGQGA